MKSSAVIDSEEVDRLFAKLDKQFSRDIVKVLSMTAQQGINVILERTEQGYGYQGKFKPYSPQYATSKAQGWPGTSTRRAFSGDPSGVVNLNVSGNMLGSMRSKMDRINLTAEIAFSRAAESKKAFFNNQIRPFFGFNQKEKNDLRKFFYRKFTV